MMTVYAKLQQARVKLQGRKLTKSGKNKFAGYEYFELGDFLPSVQEICNEVGLCGVISFTDGMAYLNIYDTTSSDCIVFSSPMGSIELKGSHNIQNLGAVQTYLRRYMWMAAFEIVEHDALDATTGAEVKNPKPELKATPKLETKPVEKVEIKDRIVGKEGEWQIDAPSEPEGDPEEWLEVVKKTNSIALKMATSTEDVMSIYRKNKVLFDALKAVSPQAHKEMMETFTATKNKFQEAA
jgi:hypothetical protein